MKKRFLVFLSLIFMLSISFVGCSNDKTSTEKKEVIPQTAEEIANAYKSKNDKVTDVLVFDEETDPNELLGRPNQYIGKADFSFDGVEEFWETDEERLQGLNGGTIETFDSEELCDSRAEYLKAFMDPSMGAFGVNEYTYKYKKMIFRISNSITPDDAEAYKKIMDNLIDEVGEQIVFE